MVTEQAPVTLELRNTPGKKHKQKQRWYTHISQLTQFTPPPGKHIKAKSGVSQRCTRSILVHTSHYSRLEKTDYTAYHPRKTTTYTLHVNYLSLHIRTSDASQLEKRNNEEKIRHCKEKTRKRKTKKERREEKRQEKQEKTGPEEEARKIKRKYVILEDRRN